MKLSLLSLLAIATTTVGEAKKHGLKAVAPTFRSYPSFTQIFPGWASDTMGTAGNGERSTIAGEGCAMSSLSMALNGLGITIPIDGYNKQANPQTLNSWLLNNNGYTCAAGDCNNLVLNAVSRLNSSVQLVGEITPTPSVSYLQQGLASGQYIFLAHVRNAHHFVLLTGYKPGDNNGFLVNDPMLYTNYYPYANISDVIAYKVSSFNAPAPSGSSRLQDSVLAVNKNGVITVPLASKEVAAVRPVIPFAYPLYKQCDSRWGKDLIVTETVCAVGCLMSSTSMGIAGHSIRITNSSGTKVIANPGTLNAFLKAHKGYDSSNDMDEDVVPQVNPKFIQWNDATDKHVTNDIPIATIQSLLKQRQPVIANVMAGHHFVLVTGWDAANPDTLMVNDPGFDRATYSYKDDVVGWRLFQMQMCSGTSC